MSSVQSEFSGLDFNTTVVATHPPQSSSYLLCPANPPPPAPPSNHPHASRMAPITYPQPGYDNPCISPPFVPTPPPPMHVSPASSTALPSPSGMAFMPSSAAGLLRHANPPPSLNMMRAEGMRLWLHNWIRASAKARSSPLPILEHERRKENADVQPKWLCDSMR